MWFVLVLAVVGCCCGLVIAFAVAAFVGAVAIVGAVAVALGVAVPFL